VLWSPQGPEIQIGQFSG